MVVGESDGGRRNQTSHSALGHATVYMYVSLTRIDAISLHMHMHIPLCTLWSQTCTCSKAYTV